MKANQSVVSAGSLLRCRSSARAIAITAAPRIASADEGGRPETSPPEMRQRQLSKAVRTMASARRG